MNHSEIVSFIWGVADLIRDTFKRGKYQDVILPLTVLRRLDCVLTPSKEKVLKRQAELRGKGLQDLDAQLRKASSFAFYNTSRYDFDKLLADAPHIAPNLRNYIAGFSPNMREVLEKFDFDNTISKLTEAGLLFQVLERFKNVDLHPDKVDNPTMGTIFEELLRKFNEALNENPGEHFTPRDVVHLMVDLMLAGDADRIRRKGIVCTVYDPCCGSGGMLMITKEHITVGLRKNGDLIRSALNKDTEIHLFGQEVNPETWAVSKSDLFIKEPTGRDADNIAFGSTLSNDRHAQRRFDYLIANPPYGKDWKRDEDPVRAEHERGAAGDVVDFVLATQPNFVGRLRADTVARELVAVEVCRARTVVRTCERRSFRTASELTVVVGDEVLGLRRWPLGPDRASREAARKLAPGLARRRPNPPCRGCPRP
jgi:type I restriction enzyme M protein